MNLDNNELTAYIGMEVNALLKEGYSPSKTKHLVTAQLVEMIMETVAVTTGGELDLFAVKPMLVSVKYIVDLELEKEKEDEFSALPLLAKDIEELSRLSSYLDRKIRLINEVDK